MIDVNLLYNRLDDLVLKAKTGDLTSDQFNRLLVAAQSLVFDFEYANYEKTQYVSDALSIFVKTASSTITAGDAGARPSDYRHDLENSHVKLAKIVDGVTVTSEVTATYLTNNEIRGTIDSALRAPSDPTRYYYHYQNEKIKVLPAVNGYFYLLYLRNPSTPYRAVDLDVSNDQENFTETGTTHLEWPEGMLRTFEDIMCWYMGLQVRDSDIVQWATQKLGNKPQV